MRTRELPRPDQIVSQELAVDEGDLEALADGPRAADVRRGADPRGLDCAFSNVDAFSRVLAFSSFKAFDLLWALFRT
jgi:hypothetical protein